MRFLNGCSCEDPEGLVIGVRYGVRSGKKICVYCWLGTGFDIYSYGMTFWLDKGIDIISQIDIFMFVVMEGFRVL